MSTNANKISCQQAYLSRVFAGKAHLSSDQIVKVCEFFLLDKIETDYFLFLNLFNRSPNEQLKIFYETKLKEISAKKTNISNRIKSFEELNINDIAVYYSDWTYQAIHVATAIKNYQTIPRIAQKFNLSESKVNKVLEFLTKSGLVEVKNHFYKNSKPFVHLNSDSDFISQHHRNWRIKLMEALKNVNENMHYSFVISCSEVDATKIKEIMIESIKLLRLYATHSL